MPNMKVSLGFEVHKSIPQVNYEKQSTACSNTDACSQEYSR